MAEVEPYPHLRDLGQKRDALTLAREIARRHNVMLAGHSNVMGTFTLATSVSTTTVEDDRITEDSVIAWMPTTANAAIVMAKLSLSSVVEGRPYNASAVGQFVLSHPSVASSDYDFSYIIFG